MGDLSTEGVPKRKRDLDSQSYRQGIEAEAESTYSELHEKHGNKYDVPRLHLWARMISNGLHSDFYAPPEIPVILGSTPKRARRESLSDAISGASVAIVDALKGKEKAQEPSTSAIQSGISLGKISGIAHEEL